MIRGVGIAIAFGTIGLIWAAATGCAVGCIDSGNGTTCTAKSLQRFDGAPTAPQAYDRAPGSPLTIDVQYGNVIVGRSASGKVEVEFHPFCYAGHDEKASADQQLAQNLKNGVGAGNGLTVSVTRNGGSNGLGADAVVRLPDSFDGPLTIVNHGDGPLNEFDIKVDFVGKAPTMAVTNQSSLGACAIQGAPTVRNTTVQCGEKISLLDVADDVNVINSEQMFHGPEAAIAVRIAAVSPNAHGGKIISNSGGVHLTMPRAGGYVVNAKSPVKGVVQAQNAGGCQAQGGGNAQTFTCGRGPTYEVVAGANPDYAGRPEDSNVIFVAQ